MISSLKLNSPALILMAILGMVFYAVDVFVPLLATRDGASERLLY